MPDAPQVLDSPNPSAANLDPNAPPSAPAPDTSGWTRDWVKEGSFDHTAFDKAPDDFKALRKELETFKSPQDLAKSYHELRALSSKKGSDLLEPLPKDASSELKSARMDAIRKAVGAPDKPEGYTVEWPKELPENMRDMKSVGEFAKLAHEEGVSQAAFQRAINLDIQRQSQAVAAQQAATKAMWDDQDQLARTAAAKEGLDYGKARDFAERAAKRYGGLDKDNPLFQNATFLMMAARVGRAMGEHQLVQGDTSDQALRQHTPESAGKALLDIIGKPGVPNLTNPKWFAYWNRDPENYKKEKVHPDHDVVVQECHRLSALANANRKR